MIKVESELIRESVFTQLRKRILSQEIKAGEKLNEKDLAEKLGVSRTPVREALHKLELENLVEIFPRRYCLVKGISFESIHEIHLIRSQLEPIAAYYAIDNLTEKDLEYLENLLEQSTFFAEKNNTEKLMSINGEFHQLIYRASHLPRIVNILENMHDYFESFRSSFMSRPDLVQRSLEEHHEILIALKEKDREKVKDSYQKHLEGVLDYEGVILEDLMKRKEEL